MPDITYPYLPVTGDTLDPDLLNRDLYSTTAGESAYETGNGNIDTGNLAAAFRVKPHMVRPWTMGKGGHVGNILPVTYFQDAWGKSVAYYPIAGASVTWYQEFDATMALFFASAFVTQWRMPGPQTDQGWGEWVSPAKMYLRCFFDDNNTLNHTKRELAQTVHFEALAMPALRLHTGEAKSCHHYNLHHARRSGGSGVLGPLLKGWRSFGLGIYLERNPRGDTNPQDRLDLLINDNDNDIRPIAIYHMIHRVKMYVRNATFLAFK